MYKNDYAFCILQNGKVLKENNNQVLVPLNSEYSVRVRNKSRVRCSVDLFVDGKTAIKNVVINADSFVDIPGFYDEKTGETRRFRLVTSDNKKVEQPGDSQNGLVEVRIYREAVININNAPVYAPINQLAWCLFCGNWAPLWHYHTYTHPYPAYPQPIPYYPAPIWYSTETGGCITNIQTTNNPVGTNNAGVTGMQNFQAQSSLGDVASIPGNLVDSSLTASTSFTVDDTNATTMSLRLLGVKQVIAKCNCGYKRKNENFCPNCGDKFFKN